MSKSAYRPQRRLRSEFLSLLLTFAVPAALALLIYSSLRALPTTCAAPEVAPTDSFGAFIFLKPAQELAAIKAIRSAWQPGRAEVRAHTVDLSALDLPESEPVSVLALKDCVEGHLVRPIRRAPWPRPLSLAAPAPRVIAPAAESAASTDANPFTRAELLKLED